jgi:hypothetical protein
MSDSTKATVILFTIAVVFALVGFAIGVSHMKQEAIKQGKAKYVLVSPVNGVTEFRWNPPLSPEDYK